MGAKRPDEPERRPPPRPHQPGLGAEPEGELWPGTGIAVDDAVEADNDEDLEPADPRVAGPPCQPPEEREERQ